MNALRVAIDARFVSGQAGGLEQFVIGLTKGLGELPDGDEEYLFLAYDDSQDWLTPYLGRNSRFLSAGPSTQNATFRSRLTAHPTLRSLCHSVAGSFPSWVFRVPASDGRIEQAQVEVMHFTRQQGFLTHIPSIYHPHDLQHRHLPQFFSRYARASTDILFQSLIRQARAVAVASTWVKDDLIRQYGVPAAKVRVVPGASPLAAYRVADEGLLEAVRRKYSLPNRFIFYTAQTFPHKNHIGLLRALALLRDGSNLRANLVASGKCNEFFPRIASESRRLRLEEQVLFPGFVSPEELGCLYRLSRAVVIPTLFEAGSFPLCEAFESGKPVACSRVTSLPEQAGDAAILFDPTDTADMAAAVRRLWEDEELRQQLVQRARKRICVFSWEKTCRTFRALYRSVAGRGLSDEDSGLLDAPPVM